MTQHPVPASERSIVFGRVDALRVDDPPLGIEAAADNNVMKVTPDCLFMRTTNGSIYGGRGGGSWWIALGAIFTFALFSIFNYLNGLHEIRTGHYDGTGLQFYFRYWFYPAGVAALLLVFSFWVFIPWRRELPIIFNPKTGTLICEADNEVVTCQWRDVEAYIKDVTTISAGGVPMNEGVLNLVFVDENRMCRRAAIAATKDAQSAAVKRGIYGAAMVWEYIRLFMNEGAEALPPNCAFTKHRLNNVRECLTTANPFKLLKVKKKRNLIWALLFCPIVLPFGVIAILGDLLYFALDHVLPRRKWPRALLDACDSVWDGTGD